ncbi:MAG: YncE family protein [Actinobacteria bacterium]|nr:YncE family protein [Actinomycetota bacterium]
MIRRGRGRNLVAIGPVVSHVRHDLWIAPLVLLAALCSSASAALPEAGGLGPPGGAASSGAAEPHTLGWVAAEEAGRTVLVDVTAGEIVERFRTPGGPHNIAVGADGTVAVALWGSDRIALIREGTVRFVELGGAPHDVKFADDTVVVANQGSDRVQIVTLDGELLRRIRLPADPHDLAVDLEGRRAWVTMDGRDELAVVNLIRRAPVRYVPTGERPHDLLFASDGRLWVTDWAGELHVFSPRGALLRTIPLGVEAHHLVFTPNGRWAWITDHGAGRVFVIRTRDLRVVASKRFPGEPHHVAVTADGRRVVVADHENGRLIVYEAGTRRRVDTIRVGAGPHGVWAAGLD